MISSYLQLIERRAELDDQSRTHLDFAVDGATRMRTLIDDLLLYSRAGRVDLKRREVRPAPSSRRRCAASPAQSMRRCDRRGRRTAGHRCDPVLLGQVFQNLVANGVKFQTATPRT